MYSKQLKGLKTLKDGNSKDVHVSKSDYTVANSKRTTDYFSNNTFDFTRTCFSVGTMHVHRLLLEGKIQHEASSQLMKIMMYAISNHAIPETGVYTEHHSSLQIHVWCFTQGFCTSNIKTTQNARNHESDETNLMLSAPISLNTTNLCKKTSFKL